MNTIEKIDVKKYHELLANQNFIPVSCYVIGTPQVEYEVGYISLPDTFIEQVYVLEPTTKSLNVATKYDQDKLDWSLLPIGSVEEVIKVLEFGKVKYTANNWRSNGGFKYTRVLNAMLRHLFAFMRGEDVDQESGLSHIAHLGCNVLFLLHFVLNKDKFKDNDDRYVE